MRKLMFLATAAFLVFGADVASASKFEKATCRCRNVSLDGDTWSRCMKKLGFNARPGAGSHVRNKHCAQLGVRVRPRSERR